MCSGAVMCYGVGYVIVDTIFSAGAECFVEVYWSWSPVIKQWQVPVLELSLPFVKCTVILKIYFPTLITGTYYYISS